MADVRIRRAANNDIVALTAAFERSKVDLAPWIFPPSDYSAFVAQENLLLVVDAHSESLCGYFNLSSIIRGPLQQAFLGFAAFSPNQRKGLMSKAMAQVLSHAFETLQLHRIEANIQPENEASKGFVEKHGFKKEGFSPNYLQLNGEWKDHERWALTFEQWTTSRQSSKN
jgi:ribosomal-protein-alanine N-acetyltransferase